MAKTKTEKITGIEEQIRQLENQRKKLIQQEKEQERKDRTKRLCKRMGLFESILPDTIPLSDEQFKSFLEKTVANDFGRRTLEKYTAQNIATTTPEPTGAAAQDNGTPAATPPQTAQGRDTGKDTDEGESARVSG